MDALATRAERAVLGAMLANPALYDTLRGVVWPGDFRDPGYQRMYRAIASASRRGPRDPAGLRAAITQADPSITQPSLDQLAAGCPNPDHGIAYGHMLVVSASRRSLADRGRDLAIRGLQLSRDADVIRRIDDVGADALAADAGHLSKLGDALRAHAGTGVPDTTGASHPEPRHPDTDQARREELVLAALMHLNPEEAAEILRALGRPAITDPYRREVLEVLSGMVRNGRPIDELTLDWALTERGLPLRPEHGGATTGERLARIQASLQEALTSARALQGQQPSPTPAGSPEQGTAATRRVTRTRSQGHPAGSQIAPILRLHRGALPPDGPDPGPRPR